ncbi:MAG: isochorismatase family cysteine hydrolase, partial [Clostridiales bacterium]
YDMEAKLFPAHNIVGTWGEELYGKTGDLVRELLKIQPEKTVYVPKLCYSAFQGTPLDAMLRVRAVDTLVVCGVCTDICVLHTVIAAHYLGYRVQVMLNACATMNEIGQKWAFAHMRDCLSVELI